MSEFIIAIIFYSLLGLIIYKNRKKFEWIQGIILAYRTKKPLKWMDKLKPNNPFWKVYSTICIPLCFAFLPLITYSLGEQAINILLGLNKNAGVALAIPGVRIPGSPIYIPLLYGITAIAILAFVHEMGHGIIGKSEKIKLKNAGFGMFLIFPLFFVEPDEESMIKASKLSRLRMLSAGTGTNLTLAFTLTLIIGYAFIPFIEANSELLGVKINGLMNDYPAIQANITSNSYITRLNGETVTNLTVFRNLLNSHVPGEVINLTTSEGEYELTLAINPTNKSLPYLGVYLNDDYDYSVEAKLKYGDSLLGFINIILELFNWVAFLNLSIGVMNLLPIWGLDGSRMLYDLLSYIMKEKKARAIVSIISSACIGFLIINIAPLFTNIFS